jgi:hypothetical protein
MASISGMKVMKMKIINKINFFFLPDRAIGLSTSAIYLGQMRVPAATMFSSMAADIIE